MYFFSNSALKINKIESETAPMLDNKENKDNKDLTHDVKIDIKDGLVSGAGGATIALNNDEITRIEL